jgi:MFS superfamily sulfate permease-like transporter
MMIVNMIHTIFQSSMLILSFIKTHCVIFTLILILTSVYSFIIGIVFGHQTFWNFNSVVVKPLKASISNSNLLENHSHVKTFKRKFDENVLLHILSFLNINSLSIASRCSKYMKELCDSKFIWANIHQYSFFHRKDFEIYLKAIGIELCKYNLTTQYRIKLKYFPNFLLEKESNLYPNYCFIIVHGSVMKFRLNYELP